MCFYGNQYCRIDGRIDYSPATSERLTKNMALAPFRIQRKGKGRRTDFFIRSDVASEDGILTIFSTREPDLDDPEK